MSSLSERVELIETVIEQNYLRASHAENIRLVFMSIYAVALTTFITFGVSNAWENMFFPAAFLVFLSVVSILIAMKLSLEFYQHMIFAIELASRCRIAEGVTLKECIGRPFRNYEEKEMRISNFLSVRANVMAFYTISTSVAFSIFAYLVFRDLSWFYLFMGSYSNPELVAIMVFIISSLSIGSIILLYWKHKSRIIENHVSSSLGAIEIDLSIPLEKRKNAAERRLQSN